MSETFLRELLKIFPFQHDYISFIAWFSLFVIQITRKDVAWTLFYFTFLISEQPTFIIFQQAEVNGIICVVPPPSRQGCCSCLLGWCGCSVATGDGELQQQKHWIGSISVPAQLHPCCYPALPHAHKWQLQSCQEDELSINNMENFGEPFNFIILIILITITRHHHHHHHHHH